MPSRFNPACKPPTVQDDVVVRRSDGFEFGVCGRREFIHEVTQFGSDEMVNSSVVVSDKHAETALPWSQPVQQQSAGPRSRTKRMANNAGSPRRTTHGLPLPEVARSKRTTRNAPPRDSIRRPTLTSGDTAAMNRAVWKDLISRRSEFKPRTECKGKSKGPKETKIGVVTPKTIHRQAVAKRAAEVASFDKLSKFKPLRRTGKNKAANHRVIVTMPALPNGQI